MLKKNKWFFFRLQTHSAWSHHISWSCFCLFLNCLNFVYAFAQKHIVLLILHINYGKKAKIIKDILRQKKYCIGVTKTSNKFKEPKRHFTDVWGKWSTVPYVFLFLLNLTKTTEIMVCGLDLAHEPPFQ